MTHLENLGGNGAAVVRIRITVALCICVVSLFVYFVSKNTSNFENWTFESKRMGLIKSGMIRAVTTDVYDALGSRKSLFAKEAHSNEIFLIDFVYTRCPTVCRTLGSEFEQLQNKILLEKNEKVKLLSISFDVSFDTPQELLKQEKVFNVNRSVWNYVVPQTISYKENLLKSLGVIVIPDGAGGFVHNGSIHVVDSLGKLHGVFDLDKWSEAFDFAKTISQ